MKKHKFLFPLGLLMSTLVCGASFAFNNSDGYRVSSASEVRVYRSVESDSFINDVWTPFRVAHPDTCSVTYAEFKPVYVAFKALSSADQQVVSQTIDPIENEYTIGEVIKEMVRNVYPNNGSTKQEKQKLNQKSIIILAVTVSLIGASAISVLYILKNQNLIK